ncbi:[FeFe] hydrogenase, group A [Hominifimenecus microfluidus]|uniref:[FeFe] hydrogenase, group A n=1 Tax=Hominifimenecus microfluidus TaxID=2885348 RepID=A0AAE3JET3_9FIRM|nr:[FeFe] hydrogenase, group A [Hominifimenecus microfluidus]MCC2230107.1 [FeFe] hydrogenase, group A [Hominifimenecus microfluidus]
MVNLKIDKIDVSVPEGTTVMEAAASVGIKIPSLCYLKNINEIAACRICLVELKGKDKLITSCNNVVQEGMEIYTNSPKVRSARRTNVQLILSQHDSRCTTCLRSGNCALQSIANDLGLMDNPFPDDWVDEGWPRKYPLVRTSQKCIRCMRCVQVCDKIQGMNIWDVANTGSRTTIGVTGQRKLENSDCTLCGQCITHCPVAALHAREDWQGILDKMADPDVITLVQVAPAVRTAWAESLGFSREEATPGRMAAALRRLGFDYVFDTIFSADLTIMEEGSEFLSRFDSLKEDGMPMFTSCCPGWIRFVKTQYPQLVPYLSSAKSPQQMFGAVSKTYFAKVLGVDPSRLFCVSIMPCVAKKHEADIPTINAAEKGKDVDCVLTTRELARMIRADRIVVGALQEEPFDQPLGLGTGAGEIFGVTGGVMEAALRSAYYLITGKNPEPDSFREIRGQEPWRESELNMGGTRVRVAAVSGLGNTRKLIEKILRGEKHYDFVEVMACPGGCVGGGGQPIHDGEELASVRGEALYRLDKKNPLRFSHENPCVQQLYKEYLGEPLSEKAHELLHTDHNSWHMPGEYKE